MRGEEFRKNAIRTESHNMQEIRERVDDHEKMVALASILVRMRELGGELDTLKKYFFYGKSPEEADKVTALNSSIFSEEARNLAVNLPKGDRGIRFLHALLGLLTEDEELIELYQKYAQTGELDTVNASEEIGDKQWYSALMGDVCGFNLDDTRELVIKKLKKRFPHAFTSEDAINRDTDVERKLLESETGKGERITPDKSYRVDLRDVIVNEAVVDKIKRKSEEYGFNFLNTPLSLSDCDVLVLYGECGGTKTSPSAGLYSLPAEIASPGHSPIITYDQFLKGVL